MSDLGEDLTQQERPSQLDRRQLLRRAGLGFSLGAAGLLLPENADARNQRRWRRLRRRARRRAGHDRLRRDLGWPKWLNMELHIGNFVGSQANPARPIKVEIWGSDNGRSWSRVTEKTIPPDGIWDGADYNRNWRKFYVPNKYIVAWINDEYFAWAYNPLVGPPEAALGYGGRFDGDGWKKGTLVARDDRLVKMIHGVTMVMYRTDDTDDAKVYRLTVSTGG